MSKSLLEQLPSIVAAGKRSAAQVLESLGSHNRVTLQTREFVLPRKDTVAADLFRSAGGQSGLSDSPNRLIYGDNLLTIAALLAGDDQFGSMRGKVDLIYMDPPFDSKADYRTQIKLPGTTIDQKPTVLEQFAYSDTWADGTASYLAMITPRLVLMRELLAESGSIYVHLDWHVGHYVKIIMDDVFGRENLLNDIAWLYGLGGSSSRYWPRKHDSIMWYSKVEDGNYFEADMIPATSQRMKGQLKKAPDYWDIPSINNQAKERLGFATQKPEALLERIIRSTCPDDGAVFDPFAGSGTTAAVADRLGRRWIVGDVGKAATMITRKRLVDQDSKPFVYQAIGDYQIEHARSALGRRFRVGELAQVVLGLYGALPLPPEESVGGSLGRMPNSRTLVVADSPAKLTTISTLRRAQGYRESKMGGFDKVVVLGWNFSAGIGQDIANLQDPNLEVLVIPPDLLDRLKKKGADKVAGEVRFASLQYLDAEVASRKVGAEGEEIRVELKNYVLLSPDALNLDEKNRASLREVMNAEPLALIEYWAVDPDYDGEVFRSVWQDYRGNTENNDDPLRVITTTHLQLPRQHGPRRICVRAVDVFGFESEVVVDGVEVD